MDIKLIERESEGEFLLSGRLDANSAPETEKLLTSMVERFDKMTLNLASLEYISSAGLRILKVLHMAMRKKGGKLVVKNANKMVMEVFEMTGFAGLLNFE